MIDESWYERPPGVPDRTSAGGVVARIEDGQIYVALVGEVGLTDRVLPKGGVEAAVLVPIELWRRLEANARPSLKDLLLAPEARTDALVPPR